MVTGEISSTIAYCRIISPSSLAVGAHLSSSVLEMRYISFQNE